MNIGKIINLEKLEKFGEELLEPLLEVLNGVVENISGLDDRVEYLEENGSGAAIKLSDVSGAAVTSNKTTATITWTDPNDVAIEGVTFAAWAGTKVVRKAGSAPQDMNDGTVVVDSKVRNQYSSAGFSDTGLSYGTTYYYRFFPYTDGNLVTDGSSVSVAPARIVIANVPSQSGSLTYDGTAQTPSFSNYDSDELTIGGDTSGTNAGSYTATFTPKDDYCWQGGGRTAKSAAWSIAKANASVTVSSNSVSLNTSTLYADVTITATGTGALTVTSSDTSVATVANTSGSTYRITAVASGTATINITKAGDANYNSAAGSISVDVTLKKDNLDDLTWAEISTAAQNGTASSLFNIGATKTITLNGTVGTLSLSNVSLKVFILGFDHNSAVEGSGITFGCFKTSDGTDVALCDSNYNTTKSDGTKAFNLNHWGGSSSPYNTNYGGWKGCDARYDILGSTKSQPSGYGSTPQTSRVGYDAASDTATSPVSNTLMAALPSDLRAVMKPVTKWTDNTGNASNAEANVTSSVDYLPLLSEFEVHGSRSYANQHEQNKQAQYDYYKNGSSKVKYRHDNTSSAWFWWCRSAIYGDVYFFCRVTTSGGANRGNSGYSYGLAPAFLV